MIHTLTLGQRKLRHSKTMIREETHAPCGEQLMQSMGVRRLVSSFSHRQCREPRGPSLFEQSHRATAGGNQLQALEKALQKQRICSHAGHGTLKAYFGCGNGFLLTWRKRGVRRGYFSRVPAKISVTWCFYKPIRHSVLFLHKKVSLRWLGHLTKWIWRLKCSKI